MFYILFILLFTSITHTNASIYKIIPACSLCEQIETKHLSQNQESLLLKKLEENTKNFNARGFNYESKWIFNKTKNPHKLIKNYNDEFDKLFKNLPIIETEVNKYSHTLDFELSRTTLTLLIYTPRINGLSKKDFKLAFGISEASFQKNNEENNNENNNQCNTCNHGNSEYQHGGHGYQHGGHGYQHGGHGHQHGGHGYQHGGHGYQHGGHGHQHGEHGYQHGGHGYQHGGHGHQHGGHGHQHGGHGYQHGGHGYQHGGHGHQHGGHGYNDYGNEIDDLFSKNSGFNKKPGKICFLTIKKALKEKAREWKIHAKENRYISRSIPCFSFSKAVAITTLLSSFSELEQELKMIYYKKGKLIITLQNEGRDVTESTLDLAVSINTLLLYFKNNT